MTHAVPKAHGVVGGVVAHTSKLHAAFHRRLAAEGLQEHVEYITTGLGQVLACMTRAMIAGTQEARRAEVQASGKWWLVITKNIE